MTVNKKSDASGEGEIISGSGWSTHIHKSKDPLNPWYSIKNEKTGESIKGVGSSKDYIDSLLPDFMKKGDG